jgi:hypothetical protein
VLNLNFSSIFVKLIFSAASAFANTEAAKFIC